MSTITNFSRNYVPTKAKNTATGIVTHSKGRVYKVDSGASLHMMGLSSLNHNEKKTIRRSRTILDIQTASGVVVSDAQAKVYIKERGAYLWIHLVKDSPSVLLMGRLCNELGCSYSWPSEETPRLSKGEKVIECSIDNFVPVTAVTKQEAVPSIH